MVGMVTCHIEGGHLGNLNTMFVQALDGVVPPGRLDHSITAESMPIK